MRTLNTAGAALLARAIAGEQIPVVPLVSVMLPVPQYWALGGTPLVWAGQTWQSQDVQLTSGVEDEADGASGIKIVLPGVTPSQIALATDPDVEGAEVKVYLAWVDPQTGVVADALQVWAGELDMPGWEDGPQALVHFAAEHRAAVAQRPRVLRYTNDEQQALYPGDTGLDFDPATDAGPLVWPAASYFKVQV